jgi:hypothetical protein
MIYYNMLLASCKVLDCSHCFSNPPRVKLITPVGSFTIIQQYKGNLMHFLERFLRIVVTVAVVAVVVAVAVAVVAATVVCALWRVAMPAKQVPHG